MLKKGGLLPLPTYRNCWGVGGFQPLDDCLCHNLFLFTSVAYICMDVIIQGVYMLQIYPQKSLGNTPYKCVYFPLVLVLIRVVIRLSRLVAGDKMMIVTSYVHTKKHKNTDNCKF